MYPVFKWAGNLDVREASQRVNSSVDRNPANAERTKPHCKIHLRAFADSLDSVKIHMDRRWHQLLQGSPVLMESSDARQGGIDKRAVNIPYHWVPSSDSGVLPMAVDPSKHVRERGWAGWSDLLADWLPR